MIKKRLCAITPLVLGMSITACLCTSVDAMDLKTALRKALDTNPEVLVQKAEREAAKYRVDQEFSGYLPSLSVRAGAGREYAQEKFKANAFNPLGNNGQTSMNRYDPSVSLRQSLFNGFNTKYGVERAKNELLQSNMNIIEAQVLLAYKVADAYISVRRYGRLVKLAQENVAVHRSILGKIKELVQAGKATTADLSSAESRLNDAQAAVDDIEGNYGSEVAKFIEAVGIAPDHLDRPEVPWEALPSTSQSAANTAALKNRAVVVADAAIRVAESEFKQTAAPFMPSFEFQGDARKNYNVSGNKGIETTLTGQIVGTFDVYNGGKDLATRRRQRELLVAAKLRKEKEIRQAVRESSVSYAEWMSARNQAIALRAAVISKERVRNIYMQQFQAGTRSFLDILDASHEYFLAKGSLITADATEDLAAIRTLSAMGVLLEVYDPELKQIVDHIEAVKFDTTPTPLNERGETQTFVNDPFSQSEDATDSSAGSSYGEGSYTETSYGGEGSATNLDTVNDWQ